jgi:hypothetical protein
MFCFRMMEADSCWSLVIVEMRGLYTPGGGAMRYLGEGS